jgi:hypothetical protein
MVTGRSVLLRPPSSPDVWSWNVAAFLSLSLLPETTQWPLEVVEHGGPRSWSQEAITCLPALAGLPWAMSKSLWAPWFLCELQIMTAPVVVTVGQALRRSLARDKRYPSAGC